MPTYYVSVLNYNVLAFPVWIPNEPGCLPLYVSREQCAQLWLEMMDVALAPLEEASMYFKLHNTPTHSSLSLPSKTTFPYALGNYGLYFPSDAQWREEHSVDASEGINALLKLLFLLSSSSTLCLSFLFFICIILDLRSYYKALGKL